MSKWNDLGRAVESRRVQTLALSRDEVSARGGPSVSTMIRIESGGPCTYRPQTIAQLERALSWPEGIVGRILDGTAGDEVLEVAPDHEAAARRSASRYEVRIEAMRSTRDLFYGSEDISAEDLVIVADWLVTGTADLAMAFAAQRASQYARTDAGPDATTWTPGLADPP